MGCDRLNYTSGTTAIPRGGQYHRGAYLLAIGNVLTGSMSKHCVYLWTLPMFHCNGWCFSVDHLGGGRHPRVPATGAGARHVRRHRSAQGHAPLRGADRDGDLLNAPAAEKRPLPHVVEFFTAAAPPPEAVLAAMSEAGFNVTHVYGLTETYGPAATNEWHAAWDALAPPSRPPGRRVRACVTSRSRRSTFSIPTPWRRCRATARAWAR